MPVKHAASFHQQARRDQLVAIAIEVIADRGLAGLSISEVARRAGTSRGVVGYNVGDLSDLLRLVVARAYDAGQRSVRPAVDAARDPLAALQAFVSASLDFYASHPAEMTALREIFADPTALARATTAEHRRELDDLAELVRAGHRDATMVEADADLVVAVIRAALDVAARRIAAGEDDAHLRDRLRDLVDRVVGARREPGGPAPGPDVSR